MNYRRRVSAFAIWLAALTACGELTSSTPATSDNLVDTVTMFALTGTPVTEPSGFDVLSGKVAQTEQSGFDFALNMDPAGRAAIYPPGSLRIASDAGLLK